MNKFRFLEWNVYKESKELSKNVLKIYLKLPGDLKFSIGNQLVRSTISISLNIAEGCGKDSDKDFNRFLDISMGSSYETLAGLDILHDNGFIDKVTFDENYKKIESITKQLGGFKKKLKS